LLILIYLTNIIQKIIFTIIVIILAQEKKAKGFLNTPKYLLLDFEDEKEIKTVIIK